jgi:Putative Actinobacterial Holin-X, holin superfamily III
MATETVSPPDGQTVTGLVSGIVADAQELIKQQIALVRAEIKADIQRIVRALIVLGAGALAAVPALFLVCNMIVFMLHELAGLSVWASYGIVGGVFVVLSASLIGIGIQRFRSFNPLPEQSVEAFKENVRWMTNPK